MIVGTTVLFGQSASNVIDEVIWVVGDEAILKSEVEEARIEAQMQGERLNGDPYCVIPEQLAVQKLFLHQAAIDSITVSDADVFNSVDNRLERYIQAYGSREKLEEYLERPLSQYRNLLFELEKNGELMRQVQMNIIKNTKVTPVQVRNYFKNVPEDSLPFVPTTVEVQIFTRAPKVSQEEIDHIKADLRSYTERINSGRDRFSTLAVMYSEDGSASKGGELGFMSRGELVPEFANVAFSLTDPNTVSKIVESEYGYHIIQLIEKRGEKVNVPGPSSRPSGHCPRCPETECRPGQGLRSHPRLRCRRTQGCPDRFPTGQTGFEARGRYPDNQGFRTLYGD